MTAAIAAICSSVVRAVTGTARRRRPGPRRGDRLPGAGSGRQDRPTGRGTRSFRCCWALRRRLGARRTRAGHPVRSATAPRTRWAAPRPGREPAQPADLAGQAGEQPGLAAPLGDRVAQAGEAGPGDRRERLGEPVVKAQPGPGGRACSRRGPVVAEGRRAGRQLRVTGQEVAALSAGDELAVLEGKQPACPRVPARRPR